MSTNPDQHFNQPHQGGEMYSPDQNPRRPRHPMANYQFSSDELRVLKECNRESFYQRSLPLGTALGLAAYFGVKRGFLRPNSRWGAVPKVCIGVIAGYFFGKFSYRNKCAEKLIQLPNSRLGELLKQRKRGGLYESLTPDQGFGTGLALPGFGNSPTDTYTDEYSRQAQTRSNSGSLNLDTERPTSKELDDTYRPNLDSPITKFDDNLPLDPPKTPTSYDELRQKNRDEYMRKMRGGGAPPSMESAASPVERRPPQPSSGADGPSGQKNKYGDVWTQ
ncbi:OCIA domain-containing protein [Sergentomyia squamirostris]